MLEIQFKDFVLPKYQRILDFKEELAPVQAQNGLWGYINKRGREVIPCQYLSAGDFSGGLASVQDKITKNYGYINQKNNVVIPFMYSDACDFSEELAAVMNEKGLYGYINVKNEPVIEHSFKEAEAFKNGFARVTLKAPGMLTATYINKNGNSNGKCYTQTFPNDNGIAVASFFEKNYLLCGNELSIEKNINMDIIIQGNSEGLIRVYDRKNEKYAFLDEELNYKYFPIYTKARDFKNNISIVEIDDKLIGFIEKNRYAGFFSKEYEYMSIDDFSENLASVQNIDGLYGFINKNKKEVISCQYNRARKFSNGLAAVEDINGSLCYINKKNIKKIIIPNVYGSVLELFDKTIYIKAQTEEELYQKKLLVLQTLKQELINDVNLKIVHIKEDFTANLYESNKIMIKK